MKECQGLVWARALVWGARALGLVQDLGLESEWDLAQERAPVPNKKFQDR